MSFSFAANCLTRVVMDGRSEVEVAQLQSAVQRIRQSLLHLPVAQREPMANALLDIAMTRLSAHQRHFNSES